MAKDKKPDLRLASVNVDSQGTLDHTPDPNAALFKAQGAAADRKMGIAAVMLAGIVRMQYLENARKRREISAIYLPGSENETQEYERLLRWWNRCSDEKKQRIMILAQDLALAVDTFASEF